MEDLRIRPAVTARGALAAVLGLALCSCAGARPSPDEPPVPDASGWVSPRHRDHPLVGKIGSPAAAAFVDEAALLAAATGAHRLLLGETHDNPDHHRWQARLVRAVTATGRRPALAFEMLDTGKQAQVDAALAKDPRSATALAAAVDWAKSGWPAFGLYRPVFEAGLEAGLPVVAANLPRAAARELVSKGPASLPAPVRERLERATPFPEDVLRALRKQMFESHCGEFPDALVEPMLLAQRARDAQMAELLVSSDRGGGAILVAGRGHVRADVGVPTFLAGQAAPGPTVAITFAEVDPERPAPEDYRSEFRDGPLPFDLVIFTPAAERADPCEELRERQAAKKAKAASAP